jgi:hypothetical protein
MCVWCVGLVESGVKMLGFGLSGLGFGASSVPMAVASSAAARELYGGEACEQILKLLPVTAGGAEAAQAQGQEGEGQQERGHVLALSPSALSVWSTSSSVSGGGGLAQSSEPGSQWGQCLAEHDLAGLLSQDVTTQLRGKVTSQRDKDLTNRQFVVVDAMLYQCTPGRVVSMAVLSLAPSPNSTAWELWMHVVELSVTAAAAASEGALRICLRRRVAFMKKPSSKQLHPELFRKERSNDSDSLFVTWFNGIGTGAGSGAGAVSTADHFSFHALEVVDVDHFCAEASTGAPSAEDDSGAYLEYLHLHGTDASEARLSCLSEGVVTGVPLATSDTTHRPFLSINVVASLNNTAYSSGRNRATQSVPTTALPIYELTLVWRDGALFSCVPPRASSLELYTTSKAGVAETEELRPEDIIMKHVCGEGRGMSENQCFTALVKATSGTSRANANGKLLNRAGAVSILEGALVVSRLILNQRELNTTVSSSSGGTAADLLSHRLLMEKKQNHDKLFPLMQSVLDNSNAGDLNLHELSWHQSLLLGSLVLSKHMRDVRLFGDATPSVAPRGVATGGLTSPASRFTPSQGKKRDRLSSREEEGQGQGQDEFLGAVQRGMQKVLPPAAQSDMPGHSPEDIFFAHPFLLPVGLYRIAKEIEQRREVTKGQSNHTLLATTCNVLSLLLSVIQAPRVTDFSFPVANVDESGRKRVTGARQNKKGAEEATTKHIEEDACCLALASEHNVSVQHDCSNQNIVLMVVVFPAVCCRFELRPLPVSVSWRTAFPSTSSTTSAATSSTGCRVTSTQSASTSSCTLFSWGSRIPFSCAETETERRGAMRPLPLLGSWPREEVGEEAERRMEKNTQT